MREIRRVATEIVVARQVSGRARRRALDHGAGRRRRGGEAPGAVGAADRRARRPARLVHGHAAQPRVRDAPRARVRAHDAGRHPEPVAGRGGRRRRRCRPRSSTTSTCGSTTTGSSASSTRSARRCTSRSTATASIRRSCRRSARPNRAGSSWYETLALLRRVIESRRVVGCDLVELCPAARHRRAELPLRQADLQDSVVPVRRRGEPTRLRPQTQGVSVLVS